MIAPLVSVICTSHNHRSYIKTAVESVLSQTYKNIELIIIDDHSTDGTRDSILEVAGKNPGIQYRFLETRSGICRAFNSGWELSQGKYLIDLSADDVLMPGRVAEGIRTFEEHDESFGVNFTDAEYIDAAGKTTGYHFRRDPSGHSPFPVKQGMLYPLLLSRYYICTPTMMFRREVMDYLVGYDESLVYEDFDFWVRTAKKFRYCYTDQVLVKKRILENSLSSGQYSRNSPIPGSTLTVCLKAESINENEEDRIALKKRAEYEFRKSLMSGNIIPAKGFAAIIVRNSRNFFTRIFYRIFSFFLAFFK